MSFGKEDENDFENVIIKHEAHSTWKYNPSPDRCVTVFARTLYELEDGCNFANKNEEI